MFNWQSPELLKGMTEVSAAGWSHPAACAPNENNFAAKMPWPRMEGVDSAEKSEYSRPEAALQKDRPLASTGQHGFQEGSLQS